MSSQPAFFANKTTSSNQFGWESGAFASSSQTEFLPNVWDSPSRLTFSLAPDTTQISDYSNSLFDSFSNLLSAERMKSVISEAFQTWARHSNLNFGFVADGGNEFGIGGPTQGDTGFGDIRFGAIPMGADVFAVSIPNDDAISGTWTGDILFNSNAGFDSVRHFKAVAIHEIGHSLGLKHSENRRSVMHENNRRLSLAETDISNLQEIYGVRALDQYDVDNERNDVFDDATRIKHSGSLNGSIPFVVYGDIENASDVDHFYLRPVDEYLGPVSFRVVSSGISLLRTDITVMTESGAILDRRVSSSRDGSDLTITVESDGEKELFIRISDGGGRLFSFGSYSLVATFDGLVDYDPIVLEQTIRSDLSMLKQDDVQTIFSEPDPLFNDDLHTNDSLATATVLETIRGMETQRAYRVQAGLSDEIDVDFYQFVSPDFGNRDGVVTARVRALEDQGLIAKLSVYDENGNVLNHHEILNGNGEYVIQISGVESERDYFIQVRADRPGQGFDTGNYDLALSFERELFELAEFGTGKLTAKITDQKHTLYVAETQLFHLGLEVTASLENIDATIWMTVYSDSGQAVYRTATRPGEFRTAKSVVLQPGSYLIATSISYPTIVAQEHSAISYRIKGKGVGDPIGPELAIPSRTPFPKCDPTTDEFCYPKDRHTTDPFIVVMGNEISLPPTNAPGYENINMWYWFRNWLDEDA